MPDLPGANSDAFAPIAMRLPQRFQRRRHSRVAESAAMPFAEGASADRAARPIADPRELFRWMVVARTLGTALCTLNVRWFPVEGEEAVHVGSFVNLRPDDAAAPHYRDPFVVYLMRGAELWRLVAQVLGKSAGYNKGRPDRKG